MTERSATLIDHAYSNREENIVDVFVPNFAISDHYPVCITRKISQSESSESIHRTITYRQMKKFDPSIFIHDLENQPWGLLDIFDEPNEAMDLFNELFLCVLDKNAPQKTKRVKHTLQPNWYNSDIAEAGKKRDFFHKRKDMANYKYWRNKTKSLISQSKKSFYSEAINVKKQNPKYLWKHLHDLTNKNKKHQNPVITDANGEPVLDPGQMADSFNDFFVSIFEKYRNANASGESVYSNEKLNTYIKDKLASETTFKIPTMSAAFVQKQLSALEIDKATGLDGLSAKFLRLSADIIAVPLTKILNLSITTGIFPDTFKKAKVTPCFKKGDKSDKTNYRPISILPILSKILERHVSDHLKLYLNSHKLLYDRQSGFRNNHSCETALTAIIDDWITAIDNNEIVGTVFIDLSKAFDLVDHEILLAKLNCYQFNADSLKWFSSYLYGRYQQVSISGKLSANKHIKTGVPQGSVLGPLLFMIYINDLALETNKSVLDFFADDLTMSVTGTSAATISQDLNTDIAQLVEWCSNNQMVVHTGKTKAMLVSTSQKQSTTNHREFNLHIGETSINLSDEEKLLGLLIDNTLKWSAQVEATLKKCNSLLYLLSRIKVYLNLHSRKLFFNAYILPHIDYCSTVWGNCKAADIDRVIKFQKRAARLILDEDFNTPSNVLFKALGWLRFDDRVNYRKAVMMYKALHDLSPTYISNKFTHTHSIHQINLRSLTDTTLYIPQPKLEIFRKSLAYSGPKIWNTLPEFVRDAPSLDSFKHRYINWRNVSAQ